MNQPKHKVLLVEDQKIAQRIAVFYLSRLGCDVETAETGSRALEMFRDRHYDLIFMDLGLEDIDGLTVTETIRRSEEPGRRVPIVVLTAHNAEDIRHNCIEAGVDDFLAKPIVPESGKLILEKFLGRHCERAP